MMGETKVDPDPLSAVCAPEGTPEIKKNTSAKADAKAEYAKLQ
jgi:hypothetical protein